MTIKNFDDVKKTITEYPGAVKAGPRPVIVSASPDTVPPKLRNDPISPASPVTLACPPEVTPEKAVYPLAGNVVNDAAASPVFPRNENV